MPYEPGTQYRGDGYIARGQENAWQTLGGILQEQLAQQKQSADKATALRKVVEVYANDLPADAGEGLRHASKAWGLSDLEGFIQGTAIVNARRDAAARTSREDAATKLNQEKLGEIQSGQQQLGPFIQAWSKSLNQSAMTPGDLVSTVANPMNVTRPDAVATGRPDVLGALLRAGQQFPAGMRSSGALVPVLRQLATRGAEAEQFRPEGGSLKIDMGDGTFLNVPYATSSRGGAKILDEFTPGNPKYGKTKMKEYSSELLPAKTPDGKLIPDLYINPNTGHHVDLRQKSGGGSGAQWMMSVGGGGGAPNSAGADSKDPLGLFGKK